MTDMSDTMRTELIEHVFNADAAHTPPWANLYVSLHTATPARTGASEVAFTFAYARVQKDPGATHWERNGINQIRNKTEIAFPKANGGNWAAAPTYIEFAGIWNHATLTTAANFICQGDVTPDATSQVLDQQTPKFLVQQLTVDLT